MNKINSKIVGILNLAPDSFSGDGRMYSSKELKEKIKYLINSGVDIIDVGAESTAPGSKSISEKEELERLKIFFKLLEDFKKLNNSFSKSGIEFSLDTMKSQVAEEGIKRGVSIINDTSGGRFDNNMFSLIAKTGVKYIMMYARNSSGRGELVKSGGGIDESVKLKVESFDWDILNVVESFFDNRLAMAVKTGIKREQIILDPGMGAFISGDYLDSIKILQSIDKLKVMFGLPVLIGTSRKGFLGKITNDNGPKDRLGSSIASSFYAMQNGADFIRLHDVRDMKQCIDVWNELNDV